MPQYTTEVVVVVEIFIDMTDSTLGRVQTDRGLCLLQISVSTRQT